MESFAESRALEEKIQLASDPAPPKAQLEMSGLAKNSLPVARAVAQRSVNRSLLRLLERPLRRLEALCWAIVSSLPLQLTAILRQSYDLTTSYLKEDDRAGRSARRSLMHPNSLAKTFRLDTNVSKRPGELVEAQVMYLG